MAASLARIDIYPLKSGNSQSVASAKVLASGALYPLLCEPLFDAHPQVRLEVTLSDRLVDLVDETTWLVEFTANKTTPRYSSTWKQQLDSRFPLHGLIRHACESRPGTMLVLGLEGHGAEHRRLLGEEQFDVAGLAVRRDQRGERRDRRHCAPWPAHDF